MNSNTDNMPTKKVSSKKTTIKEVPVPVPVPEVAVPVPEVQVQVPVEEHFKRLMLVVDDQIKQMRVVKTDLKALLVLYQKEVKENKTKKKRVKKENKEYVPHGFTKPVHISPELASFLNLEKDATIARPSVTRAISLYVKEHTLYEPSNKSIFKADNTLKKLLGEPQFLVEPRKPELGMGYGYKNLQKYLSPHFQKS